VPFSISPQAQEKFGVIVKPKMRSEKTKVGRKMNPNSFRLELLD